MEFQIACGTWVKEEDEIVLNILRQSDRWLTATELAQQTGLPLHRIQHTLKMLKQQIGSRKGLKEFFGQE